MSETIEFSRRRNPIFAELLRRVKLVEAWGRGIPLILERAPKVQFQEKADLFITTLPRPPKTQTPVKTTQKTTQKTDSTTQKILNFLATNPSASRRQIAKGIGNITEDGVKYQLDKLKKSRQIRRVGPDKGGHWEVLDQ